MTLVDFLACPWNVSFLFLAVTCEMPRDCHGHSTGTVSSFINIVWYSFIDQRSINAAWHGGCTRACERVISHRTLVSLSEGWLKMNAARIAHSGFGTYEKSDIIKQQAISKSIHSGNLTSWLWVSFRVYWRTFFLFTDFLPAEKIQRSSVQFIVVMLQQALICISNL